MTVYHKYLPSLAVISFALASCQSAIIQTKLTPAVIASATATLTLLPATSTPTPDLPNTPTPVPTQTPTITPTPEPLPTFTTRLLRDGAVPVGYIQDQCKYLSLRWDPNNSPPGTVLLPIMYHSVTKNDRTITDATSITDQQLQDQLAYARLLGFQTVTSAQAADFLDRNAKIPPRSMILIIDDRRPGTVQEHFITLLNDNKWTLTLAYIPGPAQQWEWDLLKRIDTNHQLDVQAHGFWHRADTYFVPETPPDVIHQEVYGPIPVIQKEFGVRPIAFIWPGGNFTAPSLQAVHEAGYRIAFTSYSRGPLMFNWIPQGKEEQAFNDPLLLLPRAWSPAAWVNLDQAVQISEAAKADSNAARSVEIDWYKKNCPSFPPIPIPGG